MPSSNLRSVVKGVPEQMPVKMRCGLNFEVVAQELPYSRGFGTRDSLIGRRCATRPAFWGVGRWS